jgi:spore coat assembly protein
MFKINDYVSRISYNHDVTFQIIDIIGDIAILEGFEQRLIATSPFIDLVLVEEPRLREIEKRSLSRINGIKKLSRHKVHMTGKILHIDSDEKYLEKCLKLYEELSLPAYGVFMKEENIKNHILDLIEQLDPDVIVITGHDSYNKKGIKELKNYRNTSLYVDAVKLIRKHYSKDHIFVFAGACQSNFEALIASGANFASSPKRVNIDAYDPAIIAIKAATTPFNDIINLDEVKDLLEAKKDGISGIESYGKMRLFL